MNPESYFLEKQRLCASGYSQHNLNVLKESFKNGINSPRRFENIRSVADLLVILEKRDLLSYENPALLRQIAVTLNLEIIRNVPVPMEPRLLVPPVLDFNPNSPTERIHNLICSEIGHKWKDLARALGINEGLIDDLEQLHPTIQVRMKEILLYYEKYIANSFTLLNALTDSRRNDLRLKVERILERN